MRVTDISDKIKQLPDLPRDIFIFIFIALISLSGFLGYRLASVSTLGEHITISSKVLPTGDMSAVSQASSTESKGMYVGSKSGTAYHLPTCSGAKNIKDSNKIWFTSREEAKAKGYHPASNCKGLQ